MHNVDEHRRGRRSVTYATGFWIVAAALVAVMATGALPTPLLGLGVATHDLSAHVSLLGFAGVLVVALAAVTPALLGRSRHGSGAGRGSTEIIYQGAGS
jgi:hypothetical protein